MNAQAMTYSNRSNAIRAAKIALAKSGNPTALVGVHFEVEPVEAGDGFQFRPIDVKTGLIGEPGETLVRPPSPLESTSQRIAREDGARVEAANGTPEGVTVTVCPTKAARGVKGPEKRPTRSAAPAKPAKPKPPVAAVDVATLPPPQRKPSGKRAAADEAAAAGDLPTPPVFPANKIWDNYRKKLAEVVALVEAGDVAGLRARTIPTYDSGVKAMARYRDLAVIALEAKAKKGV